MSRSDVSLETLQTSARLWQSGCQGDGASIIGDGGGNASGAFVFIAAIVVGDGEARREANRLGVVGDGGLSVTEIRLGNAPIEVEAGIIRPQADGLIEVAASLVRFAFEQQHCSTIGERRGGVGADCEGSATIGQRVIEVTTRGVDGT